MSKEKHKHKYTKVISVYHNSFFECEDCGHEIDRDTHILIKEFEVENAELKQQLAEVESELTKALARVKELGAEKEKLITFYQRQVVRLIERASLMQSKYKGNEDKLTYHAGYDCGYVEGQLRAIHDILNVE